MWLSTMSTGCLSLGFLYDLSGTSSLLQQDQFNIPDNPLSKQDGTRTSLSRFLPNGGLSTASSPEAFRYCQTPLRLCHLDRCSWGRGYSGQGSLPTLSVQRVVKGDFLTEYPESRACFRACPSLPPGRAKPAPASRETTTLRSRCIVQPKRFSQRSRGEQYKARG